ncbi:MAG: quinone-dependent dihydroorotate dehydrogenase [Marmoricola sp.]
MSLYRFAFDHLLTRTDPEQAHHAAFAAIRAAGPLAAPTYGAAVHKRSLSVEAMGLTFPGILGLAAGFDKNGTGIDALAALGFGFVEIGTITGEPQPGNPKPRLARLPLDRAVVNRMGFNNDGAEAVARRLARRLRSPKGVTKSPLGINIGKTKLVPEDDETAVLADYAKSTRLLSPYADYLVVNVSSPNTPGLRTLQAVERLEPLLREVRRVADDTTAHHVPLLVKIAPDLADEDVLAVADLALALDLDGVVATNTTISREGLCSSAAKIEAAGGGGLSGAPLTERADAVVAMLRGRLGPEPVIIGVGGISTVDEARARLAAGATLLQGYTAFIYEGPMWPAKINRELARGTQ